MKLPARKDENPLLHGELRWLLRLRWAAGIGVLLGALAHELWLDLYEHTAEIAGLGAAIIVYNTVFWAIHRRWRRLSAHFSAMLAFATVQIHLDLACLTLLVVWTDGLASPLLGFFVFHMVFASLLQPRGRAYLAAVGALAYLGAGLWFSRQWPAGPAAIATACGWAATIVGTVFITDHITRTLYRRERARVRQNRRIRVMARRLQAQQEAMIQHEKLVAMGQLAAGVAHEITNPLASMDSVLQLMQRTPDKPRPDAVGLLREQVERIQRTVRELTAFAHPDTGRRELIDLNEVVRGALSLLEFDHRLRAVRVEHDFPEDVGTTLAATQPLQQIVMNLVLNALDAMAGVPDPRLVVRTRRDARGCRIEVADNGCGIAPEILQRIFDPFFTTKPVGKGTGLGLAISQRLARDHGGYLTATSQPGQGATFVVHIPHAEQARTAPKARPAGASHPAEAAAPRDARP